MRREDAGKPKAFSELEVLNSNVISLSEVREDLEDRLVAKGWGKLPAPQKKQALRRLIQKVAIGPKGLDIYYYTCATGDAGTSGALSGNSESSAKVLAFRGQGRHSKSSIQNCVSARLATPRRKPAISANPHDFIEFPLHLIPNIFAISAPLYKQGLSLREIAARTGISKTTIREELLRGGVSLRPSHQDLRSQGWRKPGKPCVKPPYGFCFFEGRITEHPKEYPVLHLIHTRWKAGHSLNSVATWLNGKRIPSPMNKKWSWNSVVNVVERFKNKTIVRKGGRYVLR